MDRKHQPGQSSDTPPRRTYIHTYVHAVQMLACSHSSYSLILLHDAVSAVPCAVLKARLITPARGSLLDPA